MVFKLTKKTTKKEVDIFFASLPKSNVKNLPSKPFIMPDRKLLISKRNSILIQKEVRKEW
jgi:hypothetical protein